MLLAAGSTAALVAIYFPLLPLLFAGTSVVMAAISVGNFGKPLTRTDALYFTVTVFSTVGFGQYHGQDRGGAACGHRADDRRSRRRRALG